MATPTINAQLTTFNGYLEDIDTIIKGIITDLEESEDEE